MTTGDPMGYCNICGQTFYWVNGHSCRPYFHPAVVEPTWPTYDVPALPAPGWECPRCHRIYAPNMLECAPCNRAVEAAPPPSAAPGPAGERE